ncbi:MAG TPA: arylsulfatase [Baekduia sp.]|uniref:arylsulfatase n=1 Tax=Baekduia sp. TaxID=2600305 RepID=UPI002DB4D512|nr:arylsulfatase [Baekduia sp.]
MSTPERGSLPIPDRRYEGLIAYDARDPDSAFAPIAPLRPPEGAPNVLLVLLDDVGFGAGSAFGGPCAMPTAERVAAQGLKYTRFHTTALCSPTRAAMITGRNHHAVGMGHITENASASPGRTSVRPNFTAPVPEILRLNGYATAHFGKCHEVPVWELSPAGPFDRWPAPGNGFQHFYGFLGGETNQWYPVLHSDTTPIDQPALPEDGYHLMEDLADQAIAWIRQNASIGGGRPFFTYFAPGATHAPHHVPKDWADRYRGRFDGGWDALREATLARQKELGVVPPETELTARHDEIPAWDDMPDDFKPVLARQMEVYAGFLSYADHHVGRVLDAIDELGQLDDTLVIYIIGDNGASAEGTLNGTLNELAIANAPGVETHEYLRERIDDIGTPKAYNHYAVGWAHAMNTPYQWTKQVASHFGGTRNGTIVRWPKGIEARGEVRHQFHHVIDVAPTILDVVGLPEPDTVNGVTQEPMHGVSMAYSFDDAAAAERHETQYFEMIGNRGIYHRGWTAVTRHRTPWIITGHGVAFDDDVWELYDTTEDWSQARDLAAERPDKLHELQRLFLIEAARYNVLPLDDRLAETTDPHVAGRPEIVQGTSQVLFPGMRALNEDCVINVKNRSHAITAELVVPDGGAEGVLFSQGGVTGGWALYLKDGRPKYHYSWAGLEHYEVAGGEAIPPGEHQVRLEFAYDGGGLGQGGTATLYVDGEEAGSTRVEHTSAYVFSLDETSDVGVDSCSPVCDDYPAGTANAFTGELRFLRIDLGDDSHDHLIDHEIKAQLAMTRQ